MTYFMITWVNGEPTIDEFETSADVVAAIEEEAEIFGTVSPFSSILPDTASMIDDYRVLIKGDIIVPTIKIKTTEVSIE